MIAVSLISHYEHDKDASTAPGVGGHGSVLLSHSGNVVTRIGLLTHTCSPGPGCSKLMTSLVNVSLKFQTF